MVQRCPHAVLSMMRSARRAAVSVGHSLAVRVLHQARVAQGPVPVIHAAWGQMWRAWVVSVRWRVGQWWVMVRIVWCGVGRVVVGMWVAGVATMVLVMGVLSRFSRVRSGVEFLT